MCEDTDANEPTAPKYQRFESQRTTLPARCQSWMDIESFHGGAHVSIYQVSGVHISRKSLVNTGGKFTSLGGGPLAGKHLFG